MTLHLIRLPVDLRALAAFAVANGVSDDDGGYALHLALRGRFGVDGPQPFRFFPEHRAGPHLLGYHRTPDALGVMWSLPPIDARLASVFPTAPATHPMPTEWRSGQRFRFEVRARPVVRYGGRVRAARRGRAGAWLNRAGEVDAFLAACERAGPVDEGNPAVSREAVYLDWLARRLEGAAALEEAEMRLVRRADTHRRVHPPQVHGASPSDAPPSEKPRYRKTEGPDAVLAGTLSVADPVAFAALLARGVGRHAAFGFGMLLLSPPGRAG